MNHGFMMNHEKIIGSCAQRKKNARLKVDKTLLYNNTVGIELDKVVKFYFITPN